MLDPHQKYFANVTGLLEGWTPSSTLLENIYLVKDGKSHPTSLLSPASTNKLSLVPRLPAAVLDPPTLVVTRCKQEALCVDVRPPVEDWRTVYEEQDLQLVIQTGDTLEKMVICLSFTPSHFPSYSTLLLFALVCDL